MRQETILALAAILWPLLAIFLWWVSRLPGKERIRALLILGGGAVAGIFLVRLLVSPNLPLFVLIGGKKIWFQYAVAAPLGALIALLSAPMTEKNY
jgi:hypothetical protein